MSVALRFLTDPACETVEVAVFVQAVAALAPVLMTPVEVLTPAAIAGVAPAARLLSTWSVGVRSPEVI